MKPFPGFPLSSEITRVVLGGGSSIDQEGLHVSDREQAWDYALHYGYDMSVPFQRAHVIRVFEDALAFTEEVILEGTGLDLPTEILELQDPLDLLVWASRRPRNSLARWSCVVLRVMHTLFHVDNNVYLRFLPEIQEQIFGQYDRFLVPQEDGTWLLRGRYEVPLLACRRKESKDRVSMLLKLLHKPENVAETIYDQIGIRLVAEDLLGVLLVIRFLMDHHVLMATHIKPSRTRNLMVDLEALEAWMAGLPAGFDPQRLTRAERAEVAARLTLREAGRDGNPHSSSSYSAVQFTARSLIRLPSPAVPVLERVMERFRAIGRPDEGELLRIPELIHEQEEFTFFFAHEVQIMERTGFDRTVSGPASHSEYKLRQREAARKRVLQGILSQEAPC